MADIDQNNLKRTNISWNLTFKTSFPRPIQILWKCGLKMHWSIKVHECRRGKKTWETCIYSKKFSENPNNGTWNSNMLRLQYIVYLRVYSQYTMNMLSYGKQKFQQHAQESQSHIYRTVHECTEIYGCLYISGMWTDQRSYTTFTHGARCMSKRCNSDKLGCHVFHK